MKEVKFMVDNENLDVVRVNRSVWDFVNLEKSFYPLFKHIYYLTLALKFITFLTEN